MIRLKLFKRISTFISLSTLKKIIEFFKHYFGGIYHRIDEHHLFISGGGIAYSLFLGLIPFLLLVFSLLSNIFDVETLELQIYQVIDTAIPYPAYADYMKRVVTTRLPELIEYKTIAAYVGLIGLILTSTWIFSSMRTILNRIFHTEIKKHLLVGILRDVGMVLLLIVFISLSTFVFPALNLFLEIAENARMMGIIDLGWLSNFSFWISSVLIILVMLFALYYLIPYEKLPKRVALLSAIWTTVLWEFARSIFGYYVQYFLGSSALYGAFVLIIVILFWVFYSSCIFIIGAEIGQLYRERLEQKWGIQN
ncbi:MAG: YihY/virulence factor BrkB family protein [Ignavibacteria bacterium]|nr:YihY/virulence factor BrkB family protein [Ignavibacteria bacterium]